MPDSRSSLRSLRGRFRTPANSARRIAFVFLAVSLAWIILSDRFLEQFFPGYLSSLQTAKGLVFVLLTGLLIYVLTRRALARQKTQADEFQRLIENSSDIIGMYHPSGIFQEASEALLRITGFRPDEIIGRNLFNFIHPDDRDGVQAALQETVANPGEEVRTEYRFREKSGAWLDFESAGKAITDPRLGLQVIANTRDITDRKNAERERERYIERLKTLNVLIRDIAAKKNLGEILDSIAQSAAAMLDVENAFVWTLREGVLEPRSGVGEFFSQTKATRFAVGEGGVGIVAKEERVLYIPDVREDPRVDPKRQERARKGGVCSFLGFPLKDRGRILGVLSCLTTEVRTFSPASVELIEILSNAAAIAIANAETYQQLKDSYHELQRRQEMLIRAEKLTSIGTMTAGIAHEILNPVNIIHLHAQRLQSESPTGSRPAQSADAILRNAQRVADICQRFRRFSRDESIHTTPIDPDQVVRDTLPLVQHEFQLAGTEIELRLSGAPFSVVGDKNHLEQVFVNLFKNARDAMETGGKMLVSSREVRLDGRCWWEARVTDTGPGIPGEVFSRLFDPFFTTKSQEKGTGLGLFVSVGIVHNHNGTLHAENAPGGGATFVVRLPLNETDAAS